MHPADMQKKANGRAHLIGFRAQMQEHHTLRERIADSFTSSFGTLGFLFFNCGVFFLWMVVNLGWIPRIPPFDPFPFGLLTMIVSLEAIVLSIVVLISQNKAGAIADLREELDLQVNLRAEEEVTRILNMLDEVHDYLGLTPEDDAELKAMKKKTNIAKIQKRLIEEYETSSGRTMI